MKIKYDLPKNQLLDLKSLVSNRRSNSEPEKNRVKLPLDPKKPGKNEGLGGPKNMGEITL